MLGQAFRMRLRLAISARQRGRHIMFPMEPAWLLRPEPEPSKVERADGGRATWRAGNAEQRVATFLAEFERQLELEAGQVEQMRPLIEEAMREHVRVDREHLRLKRKIHNGVVESLKAMMDEGQLERFKKIEEDSEQRFQRAVKNRVGGAQ